MTYSEMLSLDEWKNRRKDILERDRYICSRCDTYQAISEKELKYMTDRDPDFLLDFCHTEGEVCMYFGNDPYSSERPTKEQVAQYRKKTAYPSPTKSPKGYYYGKYVTSPTDRSVAEMQKLEPRMHIHHKLYIQGRAPWEYEDDQLVTLCGDCHLQVHQEEDIPIYTAEMELIDLTPLPPCGRCGGSGYLSEYRHVQGGVCFRCRGCGVHIKLN